MKQLQTVIRDKVHGDTSEDASTILDFQHTDPIVKRQRGGKTQIELQVVV